MEDMMVFALAENKRDKTPKMFLKENNVRAIQK